MRNEGASGGMEEEEEEEEFFNHYKNDLKRHACHRRMRPGYSRQTAYEFQ